MNSNTVLTSYNARHLQPVGLRTTPVYEANFGEVNKKRLNPKFQLLILYLLQHKWTNYLTHALDRANNYPLRNNGNFIWREQLRAVWNLSDSPKNLFTDSVMVRKIKLSRSNGIFVNQLNVSSIFIRCSTNLTGAL